MGNDGTIFGAWVTLTSKVALGASVILSQPDVVEIQESRESFPESRFGSPPSRLDAEGKSRFVTNAMEDLRQVEAGRSANAANSGEGLVSNRRPAALEYTQETGRVGSVQAQPVIGEPGMPHSPANLNPKPQSSNVRTGIQEVAVIAGDLGFFPKTVFVTRDIPVRMFITGASKKALCIMMDIEGFRVVKQVRSQKIEELNFTPVRSGQFRFYCPINGGMEGTLLVKDGNYGSGSHSGPHGPRVSRVSQSVHRSENISNPLSNSQPNSMVTSEVE